MRQSRMGKALIMVAGAAGLWFMSGGVAGAEPGVPARAASYINPDTDLAATRNPDVDPGSECGSPDIVDLQTVGSTNVHVDACLFTSEAPRDADESDVDAPASFQSLGVGAITACPDPDNAGAKTSRLSDTEGDGRNDLCAQSGYQDKPNMDGNEEYHARMNSTTPGGQVVLFCHDPDADGCFDERVLSVTVIVWLP